MTRQARVKPIVNVRTHDQPCVGMTQVCAYLGVDKRTVLKWVETGHLAAIRLPNGTWKVELDELQRFLEKQRLRPAEAAPSRT